MSFNQLFTIYKIEFETTYNWDVFLKIKGQYFNFIYKKEYWRKEWNILEKYFTDIFNIKKCEVSSYSDGKTNASLNYNSYIYIEIKPILGDDYPNVLRKMKQQKNLTSCNTEMMREHYILLVKDFASSTTTSEQLIQIFNQSNIKVIFLKDITEGDVKLIETNKDNISELKKYIIKLEEENTMLKESLKQYETPTS